MENVITLKASQRALVGKYVAYVFWLLVGIGMVVGFNSIGQSIIGKFCMNTDLGEIDYGLVSKTGGQCQLSGRGRFYFDTTANGLYVPQSQEETIPTAKRLTSYVDYWNMPFSLKDDEVIGLVLLAIGFAGGALVILANVSGIIGNFYLARTVTVISKGEGRISEERFGFPFEREMTEQRFDRVTGVTVSQGNFDTRLNTGSVTLKLVTFTNAEVLTKKWSIIHIDNPQAVAARIIEGLPSHEGLKVIVGSKAS